MAQDNQLWYVRSKGKVRGPFASGLISKHILLGRIHPDDYLSQDKDTWRKASSIREVMPDVIKHRNDPNYQERLKAARRWADERGEVREKNADGSEIVYTPRKKVTHIGIKTTGYLGLFVILAAIAGLVYLTFRFTPEDPLTKVDCNAIGSEGSVFDGCRLQRRDFNQKNLTNTSFKNTQLQNSQFKQAKLTNSQLDFSNLSHADLSDADLTQASLKAVDLRGAILNGTNFSQADLSYADLTGAKASKINLGEAILAHTIWFDGRVCHKNSLGRCLSK
jgi:hypothetical protein